jgi:hypothetical protein
MWFPDTCLLRHGNDNAKRGVQSKCDIKVVLWAVLYLHKMYQSISVAAYFSTIDMIGGFLLYQHKYVFTVTLDKLLCRFPLQCTGLQRLA